MESLLDNNNYCFVHVFMYDETELYDFYRYRGNNITKNIYIVSEKIDERIYLTGCKIAYKYPQEIRINDKLIPKVCGRKHDEELSGAGSGKECI